MTENDAVLQESPFTLTGKTAIVTGGGRGIGRAIVHRLVSAGANVLACDLDQQALQETQASASRHNGGLSRKRKRRFLRHSIVFCHRCTYSAIKRYSMGFLNSGPTTTLST